MGNCLGPPADDDLSLESFNPDSHDRRRAPSPVRRPSYGGGGGSGPGGGGDGKEKVPATGGGGRGEGSGGRSGAAAVEAKLKVFTLAELKSATRNFRPDTVLGEGGFGKVFKGWVEEKTYAPSRVGVGVPIAVKKSSPDSPQGLREWQPPAFLSSHQPSITISHSLSFLSLPNSTTSRSPSPSSPPSSRARPRAQSPSPRVSSPSSQVSSPSHLSPRAASRSSQPSHPRAAEQPSPGP